MAHFALFLPMPVNRITFIDEFRGLLESIFTLVSKPLKEYIKYV